MMDNQGLDWGRSMTGDWKGERTEEGIQSASLSSTLTHNEKIFRCYLWNMEVKSTWLFPFEVGIHKEECLRLQVGASLRCCHGPGSLALTLRGGFICLWLTEETLMGNQERNGGSRTGEEWKPNRVLSGAKCHRGQPLVAPLSTRALSLTEESFCPKARKLGFFSLIGLWLVKGCPKERWTPPGTHAAGG